MMIRLSRRQYLVNPRQGCHTALIRIPNGKSVWKIQVKTPKSVLLFSDKVIDFFLCPNQDNHSRRFHIIALHILTAVISCVPKASERMGHFLVLFW